MQFNFNRFSRVLFGCVLVGAALAFTNCFAADKPPIDVDDLPLTGAPVGKPLERTGAGSRSDVPKPLDGPEVFLIAPETTGATTREHPTLYWYLTANTDVDIDFTIAEVDAKLGELAKPVLKKTFDGDHKAGLRSIQLDEKDVALKPGVQYRVTLMIHTSSPKDDSKDPYSSAFIELVPRPKSLADHPEARDYADAGIWYDAIDALAKRIEKDPAAEKFRKQLRGLIWSEHVFYAMPRGINAKTAAEEAKEIAAKDEVTRLKKFVGCELADQPDK